MQSKQPKNEFTNSRGFTVKIQAITWLLSEIEKSHAEVYEAETGKKPPTPPTYQVEILGGAKETHAHDATTLVTDADKLAWAVYESALGEYNNFTGERVSRLVLSEGVIIGEVPEAWKKRMAFLKIPLPDDPDELKLLYTKTTVTPEPNDIMGLLTAVMGLSGVPAEALSIAEDMFRREVEKGNGNTPEGLAEKAGDVVSQPAVSGSKNSARLGKSTKRV